VAQQQRGGVVAAVEATERDEPTNLMVMVGGVRTNGTGGGREVNGLFGLLAVASSTNNYGY